MKEKFNLNCNNLFLFYYHFNFRLQMSQNIEKLIVTCHTAPNIALIKYWGKSNDELILPLNGSISVTLDSDVLCTKTSLMLCLKNENEKNTDIDENPHRDIFVNKYAYQIWRTYNYT